MVLNCIEREQLAIIRIRCPVIADLMLQINTILSQPYYYNIIMYSFTTILLQHHYDVAKYFFQQSVCKWVHHPNSTAYGPPNISLSDTALYSWQSPQLLWVRIKHTLSVKELICCLAKQTQEYICPMNAIMPSLSCNARCTSNTTIHY